MQSLTKQTYSKISDNFTRTESECNCGCGQDMADYSTVLLLEAIRAYVGRPVIVTSWNRCVRYNRLVGGAEHSKHLTGRACDFQIRGFSDRQYRDLVKYITSTLMRGTGGCRFYQDKGFIHVDTAYRMWR